MSYRMVAQKIVDSVFDTIDNEEYYDAVLYGLEITISTFVNMILVVALAILLRIPMEAFLFCLFFMPLRMFAGGMHAKSHLYCIGVFLLCELGSIYISLQVTNVSLRSKLIVMLLIISIGLCILYAGRSKKADKEVLRKHRRLSLAIVAVDSILIITSLFLGGKMTEYALIAGMAMFCQSVSLLPVEKWNVWTARTTHEGET